MRIERVIVTITLASLVVAAVLLGFSKSWIGRFDDGVYRTTYQFFVLVVTGGAVSWLYREFTRRREAREKYRQDLLRLHSDLVEAYNSYKEIKRLLRAQAWRHVREDEAEKDVLLASPYASLLERLNRVQLTFEAHKRSQQRSNPLLGEADSKRLRAWLSVIEEYLNKVVKEFESALRHKQVGESVELDDLPFTREFVGPGSGSSKQRQAAIESFHEAIDCLAEVCSEEPG